METIQIDLTDEEFLSIAKMAHDRDITFNQMVNVILEAEMERLKNKELDNEC